MGILELTELGLKLEQHNYEHAHEPPRRTGACHLRYSARPSLLLDPKYLHLDPPDTKQTYQLRDIPSGVPENAFLRCLRHPLNSLCGPRCMKTLLSSMPYSDTYETK